MNHAQYDQKKIDALASELMEPQRLADGGPPDVPPPTSKFRKAAAAVQAARSIGDEPLEGAPTRANVPNIGEVMLGKNREAEEAARRASAMSGVPYRPTTRFAPLDVDRATRIAREYDLMKHDPDDPLVKMAYEQMIKETNDQYEAMLQAGIEPYFIEPGNNPYRNSPYEALLDVAENRRIGVFPSVEGFGTDPNFNPQGNPLLQETGRLISGRPALANDLFRAVHDYFGHAKPGVGFRAAGEENAYQSHAGMYSPLARRALASETRGQNSYLNYGPYGETNRTAKIEDTRFADQKAGLMPRWASEAGLVINDDRRREFFDNLARNQTGLEGAISDDGKLRLIHYSTRPLERIDPEFYGRGLSRASLAERNRSYDPEFIKRSYYGIPASEKPYVPEFGLGGIRNEVLIEPELIYQAQANPEGLWIRNDPTGSERRIAEAGYTGYYSTDPKLGKVAVIFDPYDVSKSYMIPVGAVGAGAMAMSGEDDAEGMSKGGLVDKLRSAASSVKEAGNVYKAAVGNMFSPFEPVEPQLGDPNDYEYPELRLRRPGIVNLAIGMPNMPADMRYLFGDIKDAVIGDEVPDEEWRRFDTATEAQGRYEEDMDKFLRSYTGKSMDELSGPMSAVLGVSEALAQPGIISAKAVAGLPRLARYLSNITEFATPVTVASPGAMLTGATVNAGIRALPALTDGDELEEMERRYSQPPAARYRGEVARRREDRENKLKMIADRRAEKLNRSPATMAEGGLVYDANRINALAAQLMEPVRLSEGGPPPRSRIARAAAAIRGAATPPREIPDEQRVSDEEMMRIARDLGVDVDETIIPSDAPIQPTRRTGYGRSTIRGAGRKTIPGIYDDPREIVERASRAVAPESEAMQQLFGVTREDLADIAMSRAPTNYLPPGAPARPRGTDYAELVMQPANTNRLVDILGESLDSPLRPGMTGWYIFDPVYNRLKELVGEDEAQKMFLDLNTLTGVHSANAAVANELTRGSAMNWLNREGRLDDYLRFGGKAGLPGSPIDMATIPGHMAHKTAHVVPALRYLETGELSREAKTPAYIASSMPPELGTNINFPVGDAHFVRGIGLSDVRPETKDPTSRFASWSMPEAMQLSDWFARDVARRAGLPGVPGQALLWGALSPTTGVKSKIGAPKLEILSDLIMQTANRLRITPEEARDMVLTGKAYAGKAEGGLAKYSEMMRGV
jgi:hypothetical protein